MSQIPNPSEGVTIHITHPQFQLMVKQPAPGEYPFFDYPIETLFNYLSVDRLLKLLTCFMLEKQILIVSKCMQNKY
jgi:hypothetical protein